MKVKKDDTHKVKYVYDAMGTKLEKINNNLQTVYLLLPKGGIISLAGNIKKGNSEGAVGDVVLGVVVAGIPGNLDDAAAKSIRSFFQNGREAKASELIELAEKLGWEKIKNPDGPIKYVDENGIVRMTIKKGSERTPGRIFPHVEIRNSQGHRTGVFGNETTMPSPGNHIEKLYDIDK